jgi:curved DNA-binding protein
MNNVDYYEFLQISPHAEPETIHRVYRFLAARFHPDNPQSGDAEMFSTLAAAYEVLSDPERRATYDLECASGSGQKVPMSSSIDFMDTLEGETNRRLAVLAVLYFQRRANPTNPEISLCEIEARMGFPRDYLDFTTWYLQKKGYIARADNSDFTLTVQGVDYIETQRVNIPILNKLLTDGEEPAAANPAPAMGTSHPLRNNVITIPGVALVEERRVGTRDRRGNPRGRRATDMQRRAQGRLAAGD